MRAAVLHGEVTVLVPLSLTADALRCAPALASLRELEAGGHAELPLQPRAFVSWVAHVDAGGDISALPDSLAALAPLWEERCERCLAALSAGPARAASALTAIGNRSARGASTARCTGACRHEARAGRRCRRRLIELAATGGLLHRRRRDGVARRRRPSARCLRARRPG